jgi:hypothetical protein
LNQFRHQVYGQSSAEFVTQSICARKPPPPATSEFRIRMQRVGRCFRDAGVRGIFLVHGTFVGADSSGAVREVARVIPGLGGQLRKLHKQMVDRLAHDAGNYTAEFATALQDGLSAESELPVRLLHWSGENHHIGRADGAIRLLSEMAREPQAERKRWLVWGHSHGGNVLALVTHLLAGDQEKARRFFHAARSFYRWPVLGKVDLPNWTEVEGHLHSPHGLWDGTSLDLVTFGTPIRYGWDPGGYDKLLHFVHHRHATGDPAEVGLFPPTIDDIRDAARGDVMQLLGVAGTNFAPTLWAWRAWLADLRLSRLLQSGIRKRDLLKRLRAGQRAHDDGDNVLVDYGPIEGHVGQHLAGHAVYTRQRWLLFHAEEIASRLYGMDREANNELEPGSGPCTLR